MKNFWKDIIRRWNEWMEDGDPYTVNLN